MRFSLPVLLLCVGLGISQAQPEQGLVPVFESAAQEFDVPVSILKGIAFVETRWMHVRPETQTESHHSIPPAYGVMGLRDDNWFGRSLPQAAKLIRQSPAVLKDDIVANIRGAAALLASLAARETVQPNNFDLLSWFNVVAKFPGIPQLELCGSYAGRVFYTLRDGYNEFGIEIPSHEIDVNRVEQIRRADYPALESFSPASDDYAPAVWDASPNFSSRSGSGITHVIVHDTEGSFEGSVSWLKNPAAQASAHYIFRSADGYLKQLVREADKAWHVGCWNAWTIGIEHEGYVNNPAFFTQIMYQRSAQLVQHLTTRYGISRDRLRIVAHGVWQSPVIFPQLAWENCNNHTDPGSFWNWDYYLSLIVGDSAQPRVTSSTPSTNQQNVPIYKSITVRFDKTMDIVSTQAAFSLFPSVSGVFRWSSDAKTMTYDPTVNLLPALGYVVSIAQTAKASGGGRIQQALQFGFTTAAQDTSGPRILRSYPVANTTNISPSVAFQINFDEPVVFSTFSGRVRLVDVADTNQFLGIGSVAYTDVDDKGLLTFAPAADLQLGHTYRLRFLPGLRDPLNNPSSVESRIEFTIQPTAFAQGAVLDLFESNAGQWQQPVTNSVKIDSTRTSFSISTTFRRSGAYSGKIAYAFSDTTGGICRIATLAPIAVSPSNDWIGVWVFGDNSRNQLELWFNGASGGQQIFLGVIDWFGWKFVSTPITALITSMSSIVVRQTNGSEVAGVLYIDDLQVRVSSGVAAHSIDYRSFRLMQNYPNPFNPSTTISFELDRPEQTTLTVFNTLGQQVATLVNTRLEPGHHHVEFSGRSSDGTSLPSGVYMYRLQTSAGAEIKKMMLVK